MGIFSESDERIIKTHLAGMANPVHLVFIKRDPHCSYCREARELVMEFAEFSEKIYVDVYDADQDKETIRELNIERVPALVILDEAMKDTGIRFYGTPGGYEFHSLLGAVLVVSKQRTGLPEDLVQQIKKIKTPLKIQTFVTPTCPYCPSVVRLIHKMALINPGIQAEMIDVTEFSELGKEAGVKGVPKTIVNGIFDLEGALPEDQFVYQIMQQFR